MFSVGAKAISRGKISTAVDGRKIDKRLKYNSSTPEDHKALNY